MVRTLTPWQWAIFIALTCFTIVGGLVYLIAEGHFNRVDRAFAASPRGETYLQRQADSQAAFAAAKAQAEALAQPTHFGFWVLLAFVIGVAVVKVLG